MFFRREIAKSVRWSGNPEKPVEVGPNGVRLTPRKSFDAWTEIVRNTSAPWSESEVLAAETLCISLIEIVLKLTAEANAESASAAEKQELLIAELNQRVRNILNIFGSTIIERTVPFELNGKVETRFKLTGFEADTMIPSRYVTEGTDLTPQTAGNKTSTDNASEVSMPARVLVLEDNMVIALDASASSRNRAHPK